jgi:hypothetical protein
MASWKGITFSERPDGTSTFPAWRRKAESTVTHIPGGGNVIQTSGQSADTLSLKIRCTAAQLASLYGAVGSAGTLDYSYGSRSAFLDEVSDAQQLKTLDMYFVTLSFIGQ